MLSEDQTVNLAYLSYAQSGLGMCTEAVQISITTLSRYTAVYWQKSTDKICVMIHRLRFNIL